MTPYRLAEVIHSVEGFLLPDEAQLLFDLASQVPTGGLILEIGNYRGKSTCALGLGAQQSGARIYSIDPHDAYTSGSATFGMSDQAALFRNLLAFDLAATVRVISARSEDIALVWDKPIDLLFIDGAHDYDSVTLSVRELFGCVRGLVVFHDAFNPDFPDVGRVVNELTQIGEWTLHKRVNTIAVLERNDA